MRVSWAVGAALASSIAGWAQQYVMSTVAGGGFPPTPVAATSAALGPVNRAVAVGTGFYISSGLNCVFKVDGLGVMTRVAGNCRDGFQGDGGPAIDAQMRDPEGLAVDHSGNLYIADANNNLIRKVSTTGIITTFAGNGQYDYAGDGGPALSASFAHPMGLAIDSAGNLYIADNGNNCIRKISTAGIITTVAGVSGGPYADGDYGGDGGLAIDALLNAPEGIAFDHAGNLYIADTLNSRIRQVSPTGTIITVAGTGNLGVSGNGGPATGAQMQHPRDVALDFAGNLYIADWGGNIGRNYHNIRKVSAAGIITTIAGPSDGLIGVSGGYGGDGGPSTSAQVSRPSGLSTDVAGNLYIADTGNGRVREITLDGIIHTIAGGGGSGLGDGGPATSAQLAIPHGVAVDASGNLYIADTNHMRVRKVSVSGAITTIAGNGTLSATCEGGVATGLGLNQVWSLGVDSTGNVYFSDFYASSLCARKVTPAGDMTVALSIDQVVAWGGGLSMAGDYWFLTVDPPGNIFLLDDANGLLRKGGSTGEWSVVAGGGEQPTGEGGLATLVQLVLPEGIAVDRSGNIYFADTSYHRVRKITPSGIITTVAGTLTYFGSDPIGGFSGDGGLAINAQLRTPKGVAVDAAGNVYIADTGNLRIRKVSTSGIITTIAGNGLMTYAGDGVAATSGSFEEPDGVAVDSTGNVYVADGVSNAIRKLTPATTPLPSLTIAKSHPGDFTQGQQNAAFDIVVSNDPTAGPSRGVVTVTEYPSAGLALVSMTGFGWTCSLNFCTRGDVLPPGGSFPAITASFNVASNSASILINEATATGGGSGMAVAADWVSVKPATVGTVIATYPQGLNIVVDGAALVAPQTFSWAPGSQHSIGVTSPQTLNGSSYVFSGWSDSGGQTHSITVGERAATYAATFAQYIITTVAGGGVPFTPAAATNSGVSPVPGVATDKQGNFYFSTTQNCVFKVDSTGTMTRVAGNCRPGYSGDGGSALNASLNQPGDLAVDPSGNLYITDSGNFCVRKVSAAGIISTVAGNGAEGYLGDGGSALTARLSYPHGLALDSLGNLYIGDEGNRVVRKVTPGGIISTYAGTGADGYSGDGGPAAAATLSSPGGLAMDSANNLYIADRDNSAIRKVSPSGNISTAVGNPADITASPISGADSVAVDAAGNLYVVEMGSYSVVEVAVGGIVSLRAGTGKPGFSGDGGPGGKAQLDSPAGVAVDTAGNLFIADFLNSRVRKVSAAGMITTAAGNGGCCFSGDNGPATNSLLYQPWMAIVDAAHNLYIADSGNLRLRKVSTDGLITTVAGNGQCCRTGDGGPATDARFSAIHGLAKDNSGNLYMADTYNHAVRRVSPQGIVTTIAGTGSDGGYSGDGGPATSARLNIPEGLALDGSGNLYIADSSNNRIRRIATDGIITTVAGTGVPSYSGDGGQATAAALNSPRMIALDPAGNLFIADAGNYRVRRVSAGIITTIAGNGLAGYSGDGGQAKNARVSPSGVAADANGNVFISEYDSYRVRQISPNGIITPIAGNGTFGYSGDGGAATNAQLLGSPGLAVDVSGNIYLADSAGDISAIRRLQPITSGGGPSLTVSSSHAANFLQGQNAAMYNVLVSNAGAGATSGTVTVTEIVSTGLTLVSMSGSGWSCTTNVCTRQDALGGGSSYPAISVTVNVHSDAISPQVNTVNVIGGGSTPASTTDSTIIGTPITIQTSPTGLQFSVDDAPGLTTPQTLVLSLGFHTLSVATTQAGQAGTQYAFSSWSSGGAALRTITAGDGTSTYTANFKTQYQLTMAASPAAGGTVTPASGTYYDSASAVPISAAANPGYSFTGWSGSGVASPGSASTTVTMNAPLSVAANFSSGAATTIQTTPTGLQFTVDGGAAQTAPQALNLSQGPHTITVATIQVGAVGTQYVFTGWSDSGAASHTITVGSSAATYTATFKTQYQLTIAASPVAGGTVTPASGEFCDSGTAEPINATANPGYSFSGWSGSGVANPGSASTMVTMSAPRSLTANFSAWTGVTIQTSPSGLQFTVDGGTAQAAPQTLTLSQGSHIIAVVVTQPGPAATRYVFTGWSDSGAASHNITVGSGAATYTATFKTQYQLTMAASPVAGGTVTPDGGMYYDSGSIVPIGAAANTGYSFAGWSGSGVANPGSASTAVTMTAPQTVTASFLAWPGITIQTSPTGLQFTVDGGIAQIAPKTLNLSQGTHTIAVLSTQAGSVGTQYVFTGWSDNGAAAHNITVGSSAATYAATFKTQYQLIISASPAAGGTVTPGSAEFCDAGDVEPISATANPGYGFAGWTGSAVANSSSASTTVTMNAPLTVTANFSSLTGITVQTSPPGLQFTVDGGAAQIAPQTLNLSQGPHSIAVLTTQAGAAGTQCVFTGWSDAGAASHTIAVGSSAATYIAGFKTQYQLTISASPVAGGIVTPASGAFYDSGTAVPIGATANLGYSFTGWSGNGVANPANASTAVTMSAPQNVTANFSALTAITIQTSPERLQFTVDGGAAQTAPQTVNLSQGSHTIAVATTQAGGTGTQYVFTGWSDAGAASHSITVGSSAADVTASFKTQYQLTISASPAAGGTVTPAGGGFYDSGTAAPINATANAGYTFAGWTGGTTAEPGSASTTVAMTGPQTVTANFSALTGITIQTSPAGLQFIVDGGAMQTAPQTLNLIPGSHALAVVTTQAGGAGTQYVFTGWSDGGAASHNITVGTSAANLTASFKTQYRLTISASPAAGGTLTPASGGFYDSGAAVPIGATANAGFTFAGWNGSAVDNPSSASTTVTMSAAQIVTANFSTLTAITIQTSPPGLAFTVDGGPAQTAPQTANLSQGTHSIAVSPTQPGTAGTRFVFTGWSDGGAASHSITVGSNSATYTASFKTQYQLTMAVSPLAGGTVTPASGGFYDANAVVAIGATAGTGYKFSNWTGPAANANSASSTVTMSAPQTMTANFTSTGVSFFAGSVDAGGGIQFLTFPNGTLFGYYVFLNGGWIYHADLGYVFAAPQTGGAGVFFWDMATGHWFYTDRQSFPYLYDFTIDAFLYYFLDTENAGHYLTNPRVFANMTTGQIFTM